MTDFCATDSVALAESVSNSPAETVDKELELTLPLDAFVRSIGVRRGTSMAILLGAGASVSSKMPSAQKCIWEWKRSIFLTNNPGLEDQFTELSLPGISQRIQRWLDTQGRFPTEGAREEYGFYIRECFPIPDNRRAYFQDKVRDARPHIGYQALCHLALGNLINSVWSTNFDGLAARAAALFSLTTLEIGIDSQQRLPRSPAQGEFLCVSLHGDYRYDALKNTTEELQTQEDGLRKALIEEARTKTLIVSGYSGRDHSIMSALHQAYIKPGPGALFWCGYNNQNPPEHVTALISQARNHGREAYYVATNGFDDLMTRLALHCLKGEQLKEVRRCIVGLESDNKLQRKPFHLPQLNRNGLIKSNAFEIRCPEEVFQFDLRAWPTARVWAYLRETAGRRPLVAVPLRKVLALGTINDIRDAFGNNIKGPIERTPLTPRDLAYEDGAVVSLMRQALVRSLADSAELETDGIKVLWRPQLLRPFRHENVNFSVHEAAIIFLRVIGEVQHLIIKPSLEVFDQAGNSPPLAIKNVIKLRILSNQYNSKFNEAIKGWSRTLFPDGKPAEFEFPFESGSTFKFRVRKSPNFASIGLPPGAHTFRLPEKVRPYIKHSGLWIPEPALLFCNKAGTATVRDAHPIRGIVNNRPFDYPLTSVGLSSSLRLGVICPKANEKQLQSYLQSIHYSHSPYSTEEDYLITYPGFQAAYGLQAILPEPGSTGWINCPEPSTRESVQGSLEAARLIERNIQALQASYMPHVVLIFIPKRWQPFRGYRTETENFDLHNFVKASCVQRGIATQFLEEHTLSNRQKCRVWWWLSLAMYVKSMRTPWLLEDLADRAAFVGLGFSIDANAQRGNHILLGCSHIYSKRGEGLRYRLSKIENPIIRRGNPFMSRDDARQVGETIRQLFFDTHMKLPDRVVLHKRTPFIEEEREGLRDGLNGVNQIDMLEIQIDHALRYVASKRRPDGKFDGNNYPVERGTVLKLDEYTALLWVHGATVALESSLQYFQGKRRIPAPLTIRRHAGETPLQELATEILGLSKMNWNTFDLYTKLPATLQSSGEIAKIGSLLQRFGPASYDYRLFI